MSDLYRSAMSARIAKLPQLPSEDDEDESEESSDSLGSLPSGMGPPAIPRSRTQNKPKPPNPAFAPLSASSYFSSAHEVSVPSRGLAFRVYYTPAKVKPGASGGIGDTGNGTVLVCHHGAGFSGLSFACFAKEVEEISRGELGVLAIDARRHGKTTPIDSTVSDEDLSISVLTADLFSLIQTIFPDPKVAPTLLLVGHSMGGAVVVRACPILMESGYSVTGVTVLDVVEGTALEALPFMNNILNARPQGFGSVEEAVEWHVKTNSIKNPTSARISVPSILVEEPDGPEMYAPKWVWRTPLRSTGPYWESWFTSLSTSFLSTRTARLLILAGTDRLDKPLMIGQMQGKFQLEVVGGGVGHMLHEDDPTRLAEIIVEFWKRNERVVIPGVMGKVIKKVGEI